MSVLLLNARTAFVSVLCVFVLVSFLLYSSVDNSRYKSGDLDGVPYNYLKQQVRNVEARMRQSKVIIDDLKQKLAEGKAKAHVDDDNSIPANHFKPKARDNVNNNLLAEQKNKVEAPDVVPEPPQKVNTTRSAFPHTTTEFQCSAYKVEGDVQMLDLYERLSFDNPDGGVWKQGWNVTYDKNAIRAEKQLQVVVVPHSHCDPGWVKTFETYYDEQTRNILDGMVKHLDSKPDMRFIYAEMSFFELWWSEQSDATRSKVKGFLESGQLEIVTGGWVMNDEANAHVYSIVMQLFEGHEFLSNQLQYRPRSHWSIDPFGLSPVQAQLVQAADLKHMAVQRVHYSVKKYLARHKQLEFRWRQLFAGASARTDLRTHLFPFYSYDVPHTCGPEPAVCCQFDFKRISAFGCPWGRAPKRINAVNVAARAALLADQYRKKAQLYALNTLLVPLGDDFRYDTDAEWEAQYANYKQIFAYINDNSEFNMHVRFGTLNDYFNDLDRRLAEEVDPTRKDLPVLSGDFFTYADRDDHYWSGYFTSRPFYKHMDRSVAHYVRSADILFSLAHWKSTRSLPSAFAGSGDLYNLMVDARRALSLFQHHDGVTGTAKDHVVVDYGKKMLTAIENAKKIISVASAYLLDSSQAANKTLFFVDEEHFVDKLPVKKVIEDGSVLLLFNPLPQNRVEVNCIRVSSPESRVRGADSALLQQIQPVIDVRNNQFVAEKGQYDLCFLAKVPPLGFARFEVFEAVDSAHMVKLEVSGEILQSSPVEAKPFVEAELTLVNNKVAAHFDRKTGLLSSFDINGYSELPMKIEFVHYGARGHNSSRDPGGDSLSGAYIFLPDGPAKVVDAEQNSFVKMSGPVRQTIFVKGSEQVQLQHEVRLDLDQEHLTLVNRIDIRNEANFEMAMRIKSGLDHDDEFYTDLNGLQMIRRKRFEKLPIQAQFYPMAASASLHTSGHKLSLLGRQALGVASLHPGWMEVMLDRRLDQDDQRGVEQPVHDNKFTESQFILLLEPQTIDGQRHEGGDDLTDNQKQRQSDAKLLGPHSLRAHHLSAQLHYPPIRLSSVAGHPSDFPIQWTPLRQSLPCDLHLLALRTLSRPTAYGDHGERHTSPRPEVAVILHRLGIQCTPNNAIVAESRRCQPISDEVNLSEYFVESAQSYIPSTLTNLVSESSDHLLRIEPYELKTLKIVF